MGKFRIMIVYRIVAFCLISLYFFKYKRYDWTTALIIVWVYNMVYCRKKL